MVYIHQMAKPDEIFVIDGISRRQILEDISGILGLNIGLNDLRVTRAMCVELANELSLAKPEERDARYFILLGRIANASGLHREAYKP